MDAAQLPCQDHVLKVGCDIKSECGSVSQEFICLLGFYNNFVIMDYFSANTFLSSKCLKTLTQETQGKAISNNLEDSLPVLQGGR